MRPGIIVILSIIFSSSLLSQTTMESECLTKIISNSKKINFPKHNGDVIIKGDTIDFGKSSISLGNTGPNDLLVFRKGLLFPELILGASTNAIGEFKMGSVGFIGTLTLSAFSQLDYAGEPQTVRTFSFLLWQPNLANPSLYILQLTNEKASAEMSASAFIAGARLSAFGFCSILL